MLTPGIFGIENLAGISGLQSLLPSLENSGDESKKWITILGWGLMTFCLLQCFYIVGWVIVRACGQANKNLHNATNS